MQSPFRQCVARIALALSATYALAAPAPSPGSPAAQAVAAPGAATATTPGAKIYRWKDAAGNPVYSDQPPPSMQRAERPIVPLDTHGTIDAAMREAVRRAPVTLWTNECGTACDEARRILVERGVPYSIRNPNASAADLAALRRLIGATTVPVLVVGQVALRGFDAMHWEKALDAANYPKQPRPNAAEATPERQAGQNDRGANTRQRMR